MGESLGAMLRAHRLAASLTQEALAERAAVSATAIAALERGRRRSPRLSTLRQIGRALDLTPEQLAALARAASADGAVAGEVATYEHDPAEAPVEESAGDDAADAGGAPGQVPPTGAEPLRLPPAASRRWRTDFVGRQSELDGLLECWNERRRLVIVTGEAGIGKTRLVAQLARRVHDEGAAVLWGRCSEERLGAYLPFVEAIRQLADGLHPARLRAAIGGRGELTRLLPELASVVGPLPAPSRAEAGAEERLLFEAVSALLSRWPMLVVLDDLHWADEASLALLGYLAKDHGLQDLVIVATAREADLDPDHAGRLAELGRHAEVARVRLRGLTGGNLSSLVADLVGAPVVDELVASVAAATEGNPFFAEEMTVHLMDAGFVVETGEGAGLRGDARRAGVPDRVRETLTRRLLSLPPDAMSLLLAGSVVGTEFDLSVAAESVDLDGMALVDAVDEALMSGLVLEAAPGRIGFSHAMVQDAVGGRLSFARRAGLHRRVAEILEAHSDGSPSVAADLARHWAAVADVDKSATTNAAIWAVRAGDAALAAAAADEAIARYTEASALWATATQGHADALIRLGMALQHRGRADEADARFREALQLAVTLGDPLLRARAAIGIGRRYPYWESDLTRIGLLEEALEVLPAEETFLRLTAMGLLVTQLVQGFHPEEARRRDELAAEIAGVLADPTTSDDVLLSMGQTRIYDCFEDPAALDRVSERLVLVAERSSDLRALALARFAQGLSALDQADMVSLRGACEVHREVVDRLDDPRERSQSNTWLSTIAFIEGRYDEAAARTEEALEHGRASEDFNAELLYYAQSVLRAIDLGQAEIVLPLLIDAHDYQNIPSFTAGTALCAALAGEAGLAGELLERMMREGLAAVPRGADRLAPLAFLSNAAVLIGEPRHAPQLIEMLSAQASTAVRVGPLVGWWGPVDHHLGGLYRLLGKLHEAENHLGRALSIERAMGAGPFEARTLGELSRVLAAAGPDRAAEADRASGEAQRRAEALGAAGVVAEVSSV